MKRSASYFAGCVALALSASGCAASAPSVAAAPPPPAPSAPASPPPAPPKDPGAEPPSAGVTPSAPFPTSDKRSLANGLELRVIERKTLPLIALRLVVRSGSATDGKEPGLAVVAGELTKAGGAGPWSSRALLERAESLGADLDVVTDRDSTRVTLAVTTGDLDAALDIIAAVAIKPRFEPAEFTKLKQREVERVRSAAKASAGFAASVILYRELFEVPTSVHPYARYSALPNELARLTLADCKAWHKANFTPRNAVLIASGDVDPATFEQSARRAFGAWQGEAPPAIDFPRPSPDPERHLYLVDRPGSGQSQVLVGVLGPERVGQDWPSVATFNQVLGGGVAGRLFLDVREKRSLAYSTNSSLEEPAHGPVPIVLSAGTQTAKAPQAVQALLENLKLMGGVAPSNAEVESAARYLADSFLFRTETVGAVADMTARLALLSLPDDYYDKYRKAVRELNAAEASARAARYFDAARAVIVVAGDASKLALPLTHFGKVIIVDPQKDFAPGKMLPADPSRPLE